MSDTKEFICIGCPVGCPLQLTHEGDQVLEIQGQECNRGAKYARQEFADPRRSLSTTIPISGARWQRLPVKVTVPIPKHRIEEAVRAIHQLKAQAPVTMGQVLIPALLGLDGTQVVACRTMEQIPHFDQLS